MSDVLSQNQIDALFNSLMDSETQEVKEEAVAIAEEPGVKYRKYDFRTPKKFTKDRLRIISSVYENYARVIASHLTSLLRLGCEVEMISVEEQRYYEFENALGEENLVAFCAARVAPHEQDEDEPVMMVVSQLAIACMLSRMMGGTGTDLEDERESAAAYTDIELALYEIVLKHIVPVMSDVWQNYLEINFDYKAIETGPKLVRSISMDDVVVLVMLKLDLGDVSGQMTICIPGAILDTVFRGFESSISSMSRKKEQQSQEEREEIFRSLESTSLEVRAQLRETRISLQDIFNMQVGDLLDLHIPQKEDVRLLIENRSWFKGELGIQGENKAIRITGTMEDDDDELAEEEQL